METRKCPNCEKTQSFNPFWRFSKILQPERRCRHCGAVVIVVWWVEFLAVFLSMSLPLIFFKDNIWIMLCAVLALSLLSQILIENFGPFRVKRLW